MVTAAGQIPWVGGNVVGHSIDAETKEVDSTEGFGAYDNVLLTTCAGPNILDIGGGEQDTNTAYADQKFLVNCVVYDPFKRTLAHNKKVLLEAISKPFNATFSLSILNVISDLSDRLRHIALCKRVLKVGGKAIFKVWSGNKTGVGTATASGYQSNCGIEKYLAEIGSVFGSYVFHNKKQNFISCVNYIDRFPSGSQFI